MRFIHTSDWHLGHQFFEHDRHQEHLAFFEWLITTAETQQIDLLIVSGDIYHTATPSALSERLLYQFIKDFHSRMPKAHVVITAGNHDSPNRILAAQSLLANFNTHVIGRFNPQMPEQTVIKLPFANVVAMPYLRHADIASLSNHYPEAVHKAYQLAYAALPETPQPTIVMGHLHARGGAISADSERNLVFGGDDAISTDVFGDAFDYIALGHLHRAQKLGESQAIRYSGSPLPMSFSERHYQHQVLLGELTDELVVNPLYIPRRNDIVMIPEQGGGTLDEIEQAIAELEDGQYPAYLKVRLKASETDSAFRQRIDEALEGKQVYFCGVERVKAKLASKEEEQLESLESVAELNAETLLTYAFENHKNFDADTLTDELKALFEDVVKEVGQA